MEGVDSDTSDDVVEVNRLSVAMFAKAAFGHKKHLCFFVLLMDFDGITAARVQVVTSELGKSP